MQTAEHSLNFPYGSWLAEVGSSVNEQVGTVSNNRNNVINFILI